MCTCIMSVCVIREKPLKITFGTNLGNHPLQIAKPGRESGLDPEQIHLQKWAPSVPPHLCFQPTQKPGSDDPPPPSSRAVCHLPITLPRHTNRRKQYNSKINNAKENATVPGVHLSPICQRGMPCVCASSSMERLESSSRVQTQGCRHQNGLRQKPWGHQLWRILRRWVMCAPSVFSSHVQCQGQKVTTVPSVATSAFKLFTTKLSVECQFTEIYKFQPWRPS